MPDIFDLDREIRRIEQEAQTHGASYANSRLRAEEVHRMRVRKLHALLQEQLAQREQQITSLKKQLAYQKKQGRLEL